MLKRVFLTAVLIGFLSACLPSGLTPVPASPSAGSPDPWWKRVVFYEIFVRSYYDSDGNGIGDFNGIAEKLDYLQSLGIGAIWLMPIFPSPSYHGYDVTDFYSVNPHYGTMDEFRDLVKEAHQRGMHILIDLPLNHTSQNHPWFKASKDPASPYRDWYIWSRTDPDFAGPWGEQVWHPASSGYYYGIFEASMPDLNYTNPRVTEEMKNVAAFWLKDAGVDGFRLDAAKHLIEEGPLQANSGSTHAWYKNEFTPLVRQIKPEALIVGELFGDGLNTIASYVEGGQFDLAFNFQLEEAVLKSSDTGNAAFVNNALELGEKVLPEHQYATFITNHDQNRTLSALQGDVNKARLAAFLMLTSPGTPFIYYGEEIGMQGQKPDENIRLPMQWNADSHSGFTSGTPWRAPDRGYEQVNVSLQSGDPNSLLEHYRALIALRLSHPALQTGSLILLGTDNAAVFAMLRSGGRETLLVLANLKSTPVAAEYAIDMDQAGLKAPAYRAETLFGDQPAEDPGGTGGPFHKYRPFEGLNPYAFYVIKLNPR